MALTGDRACARGRLAAGAVWVLLALAVALIPALQCPPTHDFEGQQGPRASLIPAAQGLSTEIAAAHTVDVHQECQLPVAASAIMATAGVGRGWGVPAALAVVLSMALRAVRSPNTRGPPSRTAIWLLHGGRERLRHFCVMRN